MYSAEEITKHNRSRVEAIFSGFVKENNTIEKSVSTATEKYYTSEDLSKFREDLFKAIDNGSITEQQIEKAQEDLLSLKKVTRTIEGKEVEVFVKG